MGYCDLLAEDHWQLTLELRVGMRSDTFMIPVLGPILCKGV